MVPEEGDKSLPSRMDLFAVINSGRVFQSSLKRHNNTFCRGVSLSVLIVAIGLAKETPIALAADHSANVTHGIRLLRFREEPALQFSGHVVVNPLK